MKKIVSILIVLIMVIGFLDYMQVESVAAPASSSDPNMDALTALGIDSSQAPEGYDPWSTDNPYGRDTIEISPVYELYTVGLKTPVNYPSQFETNEQEIFTGVERSEKTTKTNELQSTLYGHEVWGATSAKSVLNNVGKTKSNSISGTTETEGNYTLISTGTIRTDDPSTYKAYGYLKEPLSASTDFSGFKYALSNVAAGNFDENIAGLQAQTVMVYTSDYSNTGGLYMRFGNAE